MDALISTPTHVDKHDNKWYVTDNKNNLAICQVFGADNQHRKLRAEYISTVLNKLPTSNPIAERAVSWMKEYGAYARCRLKTIRTDLFPHEAQIKFNCMIQDFDAILSQLQEKPQ